MKRVFCVAALAAAALAAPVSAQQLTDNTVKLGVLTDMSSLYSDINGPGAVIAVQMAIEDFGGSIGGKKIEIVQADVQNKADVAATIAGRWFDTEQVDVILGTGASSSSIATSRVANDKKKIYLATDPASSDLTGKLCNAYTVHWTYDTFALANGTGSAVVKAGGKSWFFLTADYAFGYALERDVANVVKKNGGKVLGEVRHPHQYQRLLLVPAAGPGLQGAGHRPGQCRRRHDQLDQAGVGVRHRQGRPEARRPAGLRDRRALARPGARPGPAT